MEQTASSAGGVPTTPARSHPSYVGRREAAGTRIEMLSNGEVVSGSTQRVFCCGFPACPFDHATPRERCAMPRERCAMSVPPSPARRASASRLNSL